jgi:putative endopeptidase
MPNLGIGCNFFVHISLLSVMNHISTVPRRCLSALVCFVCFFGFLAPALAQKPAKGSFDMSNFDASVRPQDDFFQYANGGWLKKTKIPDNESRWGAFNEIADRNREILREILEAAAKKGAKLSKGTAEQLIGDMFASGMDSARIEALGAKPLESYFAELEKIKSKEDIVLTIANLQTKSVGTMLGVYVGPDAKNSSTNAVQLGVGGISLPNRSYYLENAPRIKAIREEYLKHLQTVFSLLGADAETAAKNAQTVFALEKRMAEAQRTAVENRNPQKRYNKKSIEDLTQMTFNINWTKYFEAAGLKGVDSVIVGQPEFVAMVDRSLGDFSSDEWKTYFKWRITNSAAPYLSSAFANEQFRFFGTVLNGVKEQQPRWRRVLAAVDGGVSDALAQQYVARAFTPEAKKRMTEMIENIREAFAERIRTRPWMSEETKTQALRKLNAIVYKIGYPDKWRKYEGLEIKRDDFAGNILRANAFARNEMLEKFGKPVDKSEWRMTPPTVNAYYSPLANEIVFPAGILQPPLFDVTMDDAVNYGAIGGVIGHELSHGFDDQGSQFDADGNLKNWWTTEDNKKFKERTQVLVKQFSSFTVLDSVNVNGELTLGENIGDLGGLTIAYAALEKSWAKKGKPKAVDGFTPEQRFFLGWATGWRTKVRDEYLLNQIKTDPHSPAYFRVNGPLINMEAFVKAFNIKEGDKMFVAPANRVDIW